ncbi:LysR family transcriptional regulator [Roseomonas nepalensis]|uniref:LysR family transcriptional regulator n=1 Tax=Muricoccus nepalensis TaxID=1854500 RepID=A0A502EKX2_9PROT|nr:LysR substrate-binding domain-containing protein [Roseomonas nepalensis]TPG38358.1 LysR family transcriptional regulator [Roseomonas nepalensis]
MKLHHLQEVVAIAEGGSIRAAARALNLAQPALTRSLADLERELGTPLFERHARGVAATAAGAAFVARATAILQDLRRAREAVAQLGGATGGTVAAGLSTAAHIGLLPPALRPFRARYPDTQLQIIEGLYPTLESSFREGVLDFYLGPDPGSPLLPGLSREVLAPGNRVVLCRRGHPLAGARSLADLAGADWIATSVTADAADELGRLFAAHGLPAPRLAVRSRSALTVMTCLAHSDLLAMVPRGWTGFALTREALIPVEVAEELAAPPIVLIRRPDLPLTPAAACLLDLMRRALGNL